MSSAADSLLTQLPEDTKLQLTRERTAPVRKFLLCSWASATHMCFVMQPLKNTASASSVVKSISIGQKDKVILHIDTRLCVIDNDLSPSLHRVLVALLPTITTITTTR